MANNIYLHRLMLCGWLALSVPAAWAASTHAAHVHGAARLDVAIDGSTVTLMLESPMASLVGFEHRANNDKDKASVKALQQQLNDAGQLFVFPAAAGCSLQFVTLESALFEAEVAEAGHDHGQHGHEHEHEQEGAAHSDLEGEFVFQCSSPEKLNALTVNLFDIAANLQDLDVALAGPRGQAASELNAGSRTLRF